MTLVFCEQVGSTEEVKQAPPPARQENEKAKGTDLVSPPLFSKPSTRAVAPPVSEPLFSRSSSLSPQEVEKEKEAAALAWAAAEEQPSHPETESIGKGLISLLISNCNLSTKT